MLNEGGGKSSQRLSEARRKCNRQIGPRRNITVKNFYIGFPDPLAFNLDHLQPIELSLFPKSFQLPHPYTGEPISYYPREWKMRKRDSPKNG